MLNNLQSSALCINRHHRTKPPASVKPTGGEGFFIFTKETLDTDSIVFLKVFSITIKLFKKICRVIIK